MVLQGEHFRFTVVQLSTKISQCNVTAVREDRMPGGRNSGAVYNLYKVKYKKHKKSTQKSPQQKMGQPNEPTNQKSMFLSPQQTGVKTETINLPSHLMNGTILKTALTNPSEIVHLRHRLDNAVSSSKDRSVSYEHSCSMIQTLIDFDAMEDIATLPHFPEFLEDKSEIGDKLCNIGDSIVHKLVSWTKKLPFYLEIPVEIHTKLLTDKWHEILVLTTAAYQALHGKKSNSNPQTPPISGPLGRDDPEFIQEVKLFVNCGVLTQRFNVIFALCSGQFSSLYITNLPNHFNGSSHFNGTIKTGCGSYGRKDDSNNNNVSSN